MSARETVADLLAVTKKRDRVFVLIPQGTLEQLLSNYDTMLAALEKIDDGACSGGWDGCDTRCRDEALRALDALDKS